MSPRMTPRHPSRKPRTSHRRARRRPCARPRGSRRSGREQSPPPVRMPIRSSSSPHGDRRGPAQGAFRAGRGLDSTAGHRPARSGARGRRGSCARRWRPCSCWARSCSRRSSSQPRRRPRPPTSPRWSAWPSCTPSSTTCSPGTTALEREAGRAWLRAASAERSVHDAGELVEQAEARLARPDPDGLPARPGQRRSRRSSAPARSPSSHDRRVLRAGPRPGRRDPPRLRSWPRPSSSPGDRRPRPRGRTSIRASSSSGTSSSTWNARSRRPCSWPTGARIAERGASRARGAAGGRSPRRRRVRGAGTSA